MEESINKHPYTFDGDRGPYINTFSGIAFYFLTPRPEEVLLEDIAHHLAYQNRSTGATTRDYSIAEHSLLVCDIVVEDMEWRMHKGLVHYTEAQVAYIAMQALLHDGEEYVMLDMNTPLKSLIAPLYKPIAIGVKRVISTRFGCDLINMPPMIKHADNIAMATEKKQLYRPSNVIWHDLPEPHPATIPTMTSLEAEAAFLKRFHDLTAKM